MQLVRKQFFRWAGLWLACMYACSNDAQDGKPSVVRPGPARDAGPVAADGGFDLQTAALVLECRKAVVTESVASGFVARVMDAAGNVPAAPGLWVRLAPSTGTVRAEREGGAPTDESGSVAFAFVAPHFDFETSITLTATLIDASSNMLASDHCKFSVVTQGVRFLAPDADSSLPFGRAQPLLVELVTDDLLPDCSASGGVRFVLSGPSGAGLSRGVDDPPKTELCADVEQGTIAPLFVKGAAAGGNARLRVSAGSSRSELTFKLVGAPASLRFDADQHDIARNSAANLSVKVLDDVGQPVAGVPVHFQLARCAAGSCASDEDVEPKDAITSSDGVAYSAYFAGTSNGAAQISARADGPTKVAASLVVRVTDQVP
jgi:hypothetical protein